jgi:5-oxopent-3-ene-1,2,5-tricarboxylate decarboxylase/2-hydroxyhepta-2,4-diene-1,7-dioate isomerase
MPDADRRSLAPPTVLGAVADQGLRTVSTATIVQILHRRGITTSFLRGVSAGLPNQRMVGVARTLRYTALREDIYEDRGGGMNAQKRVIDTMEAGEVLMIEARGELGAGTIGDILALRLRARGAAGFVTDGCVRDRTAIRELSVPFYAAGSHQAVLGRRHIPMDADLPITCAGALVMPGDVIVGDADGVVVVPAALAEEVAHAAVRQEHEERFIAERVLAGDSIDGLFPLGAVQRERYEEWAKGGPR